MKVLVASSAGLQLLSGRSHLLSLTHLISAVEWKDESEKVLKIGVFQAIIL